MTAIQSQPFTYTGRYLHTIAFPIGGIGSGCFSLSGRGALLDWELFHRPNKLSLLPNTFFSIWTRTADGTTDARVLEGWQAPPFMGDIGGRKFEGFGFGVRREAGAGLKRFQDVTFRGEYPFAWVTLNDPGVPVQISMMAYNPFIPLNVEDSGLPVGIIEFTVTNPSDQPVEVSIAANLFNAVGYKGSGDFRGTGNRNRNRFVQADNLAAILMTSDTYTNEVPYGGSMALATSWKDISHQSTWLRAGWYDSLQYFWDEFSATGRLQERSYDEPSPEKSSDTGSLALHVKLAPGEKAALPFFITWYFPNFIKYWNDSWSEMPGNPPTWRVPYAKRFSDALDVARYAAENEARLRRETEQFHHALFDSTLPIAVIDALSSQMSILKTTTVTLLQDGSLYGFEGVHAEAGCCEGSCNHVWNYAVTHAYLFPTLERTMRNNDYRYNLHEDGRITFRLALPLGAPPLDFHPAADGQMGGIMQVYRDWKLSGDSEWLKQSWASVKKALEYAWLYWDYNQDGVMEGLQHNTYDIEFYGPNSMMQGWYIGALRCAAEMARAVDEPEAASHYTQLADAGRAWMEEHLYNGKYYHQIIDPTADQHSAMSTSISLGGQRTGNPKYQYGAGCLSDQLIGAWMARVCGLGQILDPNHTRQALQAIYQHNFRPTLMNHQNTQRVYALADEAGLLLCTWPQGGRPDLPFVYCDEVWSGVEYQVAAHLIYEGLVDEGVTIVRGLRARYNGERRNPWNEMECGSHYARSLASWALLLAFSGFACDMTIGHLGFQPVVKSLPFRCFWSTGTAWGSYEQTETAVTVRCDYGKQTLKSITLGKAGIHSVRLNGTPVPAQFAAENGTTQVTLNSPIELRSQDQLVGIGS